MESQLIRNWIWLEFEMKSCVGKIVSLHRRWTDWLGHPVQSSWQMEWNLAWIHRAPSYRFPNVFQTFDWFDRVGRVLARTRSYLLSTPGLLLWSLEEEKKKKKKKKKMMMMKKKKEKEEKEEEESSKVAINSSSGIDSLSWAKVAADCLSDAVEHTPKTATTWAVISEN